MVEADPLHVVGVDAVDGGADVPAAPDLAPEFQILKDAGLPLSTESRSLPNVNLEKGRVVFSTMTLDNPVAPNYKAAFAALIAQGCTVKVGLTWEENEAAGQSHQGLRDLGCEVGMSRAADFCSYSIAVPESLFPEAVVEKISNEVSTRAAAARTISTHNPDDFEVGG